MLSIRVLAGWRGGEAVTYRPHPHPHPHYVFPRQHEQRLVAPSPANPKMRATRSPSASSRSRRDTSCRSSPSLGGTEEGSLLSTRGIEGSSFLSSRRSLQGCHYDHHRRGHQQEEPKQQRTIELKRKARWGGMAFDTKGSIGGVMIDLRSPFSSLPPLLVCSPRGRGGRKTRGGRWRNAASRVPIAAACAGGDGPWLTGDRFAGSGLESSRGGGIGWGSEKKETKKTEMQLELTLEHDGNSDGVQNRNHNAALDRMAASVSVGTKTALSLLAAMAASGVVAALLVAAVKHHLASAITVVGTTGSIVGTTGSGWLGPKSELLGPRALLMTLSLSGALSSARQPSMVAMVKEKLRLVGQSAWTGLVAGCLHSLTGPDHLAALAPLTIGRSRGGSALLGALWGGGHGTGQMLLGALFVLFKDRLSHAMPALTRWSSSLVGLTLIAIGAVGLREAAELRSAVASTTGHDVETAGSLEISGDEKNFGLATYCNGVVFGLQPDALMVILPAMALPSRASAAAFLITFLVGTMLAMSSYTACIGVVSRQLGHRMPWVTERLSLISSMIAIALGVTFVGMNVLQVGVVL